MPQTIKKGVQKKSRDRASSKDTNAGVISCTSQDKYGFLERRKVGLRMCKKISEARKKEFKKKEAEEKLKRELKENITENTSAACFWLDSYIKTIAIENSTFDMLKLSSRKKTTKSATAKILLSAVLEILESTTSNTKTHTSKKSTSIRLTNTQFKALNNGRLKKFFNAGLFKLTRLKDSSYQVDISSKKN